MTTTNTYLAVFVGTQAGARFQAWLALPEAERRKKEQEGIQAWGAWMQKHSGSVVTVGGPLGKTKKVSTTGIADIKNALSGFTIVRADSHEAAAKMFENHPQFTIFPGDGVEIMPVMPVPGT